MSELTGLLTKLKKVAESVKVEIQGLDEQINALNKERQALIDTPVGRDDYAAFVKADIDRRSEMFAHHLRQFAKGNGRGSAKMTTCFGTLERNYQRNNSQNLPFMNGEDDFPGFNLAPQAFYWYFGDLVVDKFMQALDAFHEWPQNSVPVAELRQRIAEIDQKIEELVEKRDELASQLTGAGISD